MMLVRNLPHFMDSFFDAVIITIIFHHGDTQLHVCTRVDP